jgi:Peptidase_C39 like family
LLPSDSVDVGRTLDGPGRRRRPGLACVVALAATSVAAQPLSVPAVPYLPQSEALCGGAALAMVMRYWGMPDVRPDDFAGSLTPEGTGIPADALRQLAEARGFQAFAFSGEQTEAVSHLEKGRPLIALLSTASGRHHYVVVLAWSNQRVLVHDPAVGPFRILPEAEWLRRWNPTGRWALLLLPADASLARARPGPGPPPTGGLADPCAALVQPGVELALAGNPDAAKEQMAALAAWCPASSAPVLQMAALEFRRERWSTAADLAEEAVRRDPRDSFGWKLLASSRFLAGERQEALNAWNRIGEPRLDLVQINGFQHMPARLAYEYLGEEPATILTAKRLRGVQRRIEALPAAQSSLVSYRPLRGGTAQLNVNVVERSAVSQPRSVALRSALHAAFERAIGAEVLGLAPSGDSVRLSGQWQPNRSRGVLSVSAPRFLGLPGIVTAETMWDEQSYGAPAPRFESAPVRERRERAALSLAHWWAADTRASVGVAADQWSNRGRYLSLSGDIEQRLVGDRVAVAGSAAGWWSGSSDPFYAAAARWSARTSVTTEHSRLRIDASYDFASGRAPLALWPGAGTGAGRALLLRAHPLVRDGVIEGTGFGRQLLNGSVEAETPVGSLGPATLRVAAFVDAARVLAPARGAILVDTGVGLRLTPPGWKSALRVDVAIPWGSTRPQFSAGWQAEWP